MLYTQAMPAESQQYALCTEQQDHLAPSWKTPQDIMISQISKGRADAVAQHM